MGRPAQRVHCRGWRAFRTSTHMQVSARRLCELWGTEAEACCHEFTLHAVSMQPHHMVRQWIVSLVLLSLILASGAALCSQGCNEDTVTWAFLIWCFCPLLLLLRRASALHVGEHDGFSKKSWFCCSPSSSHQQVDWRRRQHWLMRTLRLMRRTMRRFETQRGDCLMLRVLW